MLPGRSPGHKVDLRGVGHDDEAGSLHESAPDQSGIDPNLACKQKLQQQTRLKQGSICGFVIAEAHGPQAESRNKQGCTQERMNCDGMNVVCTGTHRCMHISMNMQHP